VKAASVYARLGWAVVPLHDVSSGACSCSKGAACKPAGKHPRLRDWTNEATSDADQVAAWAAAWPAGNVGVATGSASGIWVLDVDPDHGGLDTLAQLVALHGPIPATAQATTGSGGTHYIFTLPDFAVTNTASKLGNGLDVRGDGGQIVVAPSRSAKGQYRWVRPPWDTPPAPAPAWLLAMLGRTAAAASPATTERGYFPPATAALLEAARAALAAHGPAIDGQGGGLHTVQAAAILTHDFALTDEEAWSLIADWNETCQGPWELDDLRVMLGRGRRYGKAEYGCKRPMDALAAARKLIADWRATSASLAEADREAAMFAMLEKVRPLAAQDPARREIIQNELTAATGLRASGLALPRAVPRAAAKPEPTTPDAYGFERSSSGAPLANIDNAVRVLEHERREIYFEEFSQRIRKTDGEWSDADDLEFALDMQRRLGLAKMTPQVANQAVLIYAHHNARDRVREALERWEWDGVERIGAFFALAYGAPDTEYTRAASGNFWRSLVARALKPGCKVDTMVVLEGVQGLQKSTSLRRIAGPELFAEASESPSSKDFFLALQGKLLVEVAEMDAFSRSEVTAVKRVLSCQVDRFRAPYERSTRDWPRRGVFVGTTNRSDWARDDTGARRFWPIRCHRVDLAYIEANRVQLYAEAVARVSQGEGWWDMPTEATRAEQEARRVEDPWEDILGQHLTGKDAPDRLLMTDLLRIQLGLDANRMDKAAQQRAASVLRRLGWERVDGYHRGHTKYWRRAALNAAAPAPGP
jgi:hypothetical protein